MSQRVEGLEGILLAVLLEGSDSLSQYHHNLTLNYFQGWYYTCQLSQNLQDCPGICRHVPGLPENVPENKQSQFSAIIILNARSGGIIMFMWIVYCLHSSQTGNIALFTNFNSLGWPQPYLPTIVDFDIKSCMYLFILLRHIKVMCCS